MLFILDAFNVRSTYGPSFYDAAERIHQIPSDSIPALIVIGVVNSVRSRDMLPVTTEIHAEGGGADKFLAFLWQELIPYIEQIFRTTKERILYGRSDSGLFTLYSLLEKPDTFASYIASSPTVGFCPSLIKRKTRQLFRYHPELDKTLYFIYGENDIVWVKDFLPEVVRDLRELAPAAFRLGEKIVPAVGHIPESSLLEGLRFIYSGAKK